MTSHSMCLLLYILVPLSSLAVHLIIELSFMHAVYLSGANQPLYMYKNISQSQMLMPIV